MEKSIPIFNEDGGINHYKRLSARIPEFREAFPAEQGYRVNIEYLDPIEAKPGLKELYVTALQAGKNPKDVGLPEISQGRMIFRATLTCPEGNVLESGSAVCAVVAYKDWEKGESAARNRLMAALGFGGSVFDEDEDRDIEEQGLTVAPGEPEAPQSEVPAEPAAEAAQETTPPQPQPASAPADEGTAEVGGAPVEQALMRQIQHQADLKGLTLGSDIRHPASNEDAKDLLKELMRATA